MTEKATAPAAAQPRSQGRSAVHLHPHLPSYLTEAEPLVQHTTSQKASEHWGPGRPDSGDRIFP